MKRSQVLRFAAFVTVLAVLLGYVVYHRVNPGLAVSAKTNATATTRHRLTQLENYFTNFRMNRDQLMSKEIATLRSLTGNSQISRAARDQAASTMVEDTQELKQEAQIEGLLAGRGFPLSAATVTRREVVVMVGGVELSSQQVAKIADTATSVTGLSPENVVILPKS